MVYEYTIYLVFHRCFCVGEYGECMGLHFLQDTLTNGMQGENKQTQKVGIPSVNLLFCQMFSSAPER